MVLSLDYGIPGINGTSLSDYTVPAGNAEGVSQKPDLQI